MNKSLRKSISLVLLVAFVVLAVAGGLTLGTGTVQVQAANVVLNPGFENGSASWVISAHSYIVSTDKHSGTYSMQVVGTGDWSNNFQGVNVNTNTNYTFSFWGKCAVSQTFKVMDNSWAVINSGNTTANNTWTYYSLTFNSGSNTQVLIDLADSAAGTCYYDDFSVDSGSATATPTNTPVPTSTPTPVPTSTPTPVPGIIGYTNDGTQSDGVAANFYNALRYQASSSMTVTQMKIKVSVAGTGKMKCAIYSDNAGTIGSFLKGTNELSNLGLGWQTFSLTSGQALTSGTYYWLVSWRDGNYSIASDAATAVNYWGSLTYAANWPTNLPASGGQSNYRHSFYATTGGATPTPAPTATNTPAPTSTPTPTSTPRPTNTPTPGPTATNTPTPAATPTPGGRYMGINAGCTADWEGSHIFADAMKQCRTFRSYDDTADASIDSNGWPNQDFSVVVWHGIDRMNGTYALSFNGQCTSVTPSFGSASVSALSYNSGTNTTTATLTYNSTDGSGLKLQFLGTKRTSGSLTNTGLTNVKLMRPTTQGSTSSFSTATNFTSQYKTIIQNFKGNRFMDFTATNGKTAEVNWADRVKPGYATQQVSGGTGYGWQGKGGAWEYTVMLCNETNTDPWICIPVAVTDDYITKVAQLFRYGSDGTNPYTSTQASPVYPPLNSNLNIYIEYANELWNFAGAFGQSPWNRDQAVAEVNAGGSPLNYDGESGSYQLGWRRQAKRTVEISNIFRSVFGDAAMITRVRPVLEWQQGNGQDTANIMLNFMNNWYNNADGSHVGTPHPVNYFIFGGSGSAYYNPQNDSDTLDINNIWTSDTYSTANWAAPQKTDATFAAAFGLKRTAYEGGPSMDNLGHSEAIKAQAWNDSRMKTCVQDHENFWEQYDGDMLFYFYAATSDIGAGYYQWAFVKNIYDPINTSPKMQAIQTLNGAGKTAVSIGSTIGTVRDGKNFDMCQVTWQSPGTGAFTLSSSPRWTAYNYYATSTANRSVVVNYTASGSATCDVYINNNKVGTISTSGGTNVNYTSNTLSMSSSDLLGVRLECKSGSITINTVKLQ